MQDKKDLRTLIRKKRDALSEKYKSSSSKAIAEHLIFSDSFIRARSVFVYISSPDEPNTAEIINAAFAANKKVYVPRCITKGIMDAVRVTPDTEYVKGYMGISEPESGEKASHPKKIDLCIIPCVSASLRGERLGHGAAFYDIFLKAADTEKICLCFAELLSENIPTDENDIFMDAVITENGITVIQQKNSQVI